MAMKFDQFTQEVVNKIREYLPETFKNAEVELQTVTKTNDLQLTGLTIRSVDSNISPTIYLENFYEKMQQDNEDLNSILSEIAEVRVRHEVSNVFDTDDIMNWDRVKDRIVPKLINRNWNQHLLKDRAFAPVSTDLACIYQILLSQKFDGNASIPITLKLMNTWKTDVETLHELALTNMKRLTPPTFEPMTTVLRSMMGSDADDLLADFDETEEKMFVLSNKSRINGAASILNDEFMRNIYSKLGDFYILSSSIHELIIVKNDNNMMSPDELNSMICEVNETQVSVDERLSGHAYRWTLEEGLIPA